MWRRNFRSISVLAGIAAGFLGVGLLFAEQLGREEGGSPGRARYSAAGFRLRFLGFGDAVRQVPFLRGGGGQQCGRGGVADARGGGDVLVLGPRPEGAGEHGLGGSSCFRVAVTPLSGAVRLRPGVHQLYLAAEGSSGGGSRHARLCEPPGGRRPGVRGGRGRDDVDADGRAVHHPGEHRAGEENASGRFRRGRARAFPCGRHGVQKRNIVPGT